GGAWDKITGGDQGITPKLPDGINVGRVVVAMGNGRIGDERYVYVLIGTKPGNNTPPNVDLGGFDGLYKSSNNLLDWTKVMIRQNEGSLTAHSFKDISLGKETSYASA